MSGCLDFREIQVPHGAFRRGSPSLHGPLTLLQKEAGVTVYCLPTLTYNILLLQSTSVLGPADAKLAAWCWVASLRVAGIPKNSSGFGDFSGRKEPALRNDALGLELGSTDC